jgi:hypothetical protein
MTRMFPSNFPTNTVVLITAAMIQTGVVAWLLLSAALSRLPLAPHTKRNWRWGAGFLLTAWLVVRLVMQVSPPGGRVLGAYATVAFVVFGMVAGTLPLWVSPTFRQLIQATPPTWIIGFHAGRFVGGLFLGLLDLKLLPPSFALPAGYGDVSVALLAMVVVYLLATRKPYARTAAIGWNLLGILDLVVALITGVTYIPPFVRQHAAMVASPLYINYVLIIPAYGVPIMSVFHVYSLHQLFSHDMNSQNKI